MKTMKRAVLVLSIFLLAACKTEEHRYANAAMDRTGARSGAPLWSSQRLFAQCNTDRIQSLASGVEPLSCKDGVIGELTHGTTLALVSHAPCDGDKLKAVRVLEGTLEGKTGCMHPKTLSAAINP